MSTLQPMVWTNGAYSIKQAATPDAGLPASYTPPGAGLGFWAAGSWTLNSKGYAQCKNWWWCPLPLGQIVTIPGPSGQQVPSVTTGDLYSMTAGMGTVGGKSVSNVALADGPWLNAGGSGMGAGTLVASNPASGVVPTADPSGWSGGTWIKPSERNMYVYANGQLSTSSAGTWAAVLGGLALAGAGAAAL